MSTTTELFLNDTECVFGGTDGMVKVNHLYLNVEQSSPHSSGQNLSNKTLKSPLNQPGLSCENIHLLQKQRANILALHNIPSRFVASENSMDMSNLTDMPEPVKATSSIPDSSVSMNTGVINVSLMQPTQWNDSHGYVGTVEDVKDGIVGHVTTYQNVYSKNNDISNTHQTVVLGNDQYASSIVRYSGRSTNHGNHTPPPPSTKKPALTPSKRTSLTSTSPTLVQPLLPKPKHCRVDYTPHSCSALEKLVSAHIKPILTPQSPSINDKQVVRQVVELRTKCQRNLQQYKTQVEILEQTVRRQ